MRVSCGTVRGWPPKSETRSEGTYRASCAGRGVHDELHDSHAFSHGTSPMIWRPSRDPVAVGDAPGSVRPEAAPDANRTKLRLTRNLSLTIASSGKARLDERRRRGEG